MNIENSRKILGEGFTPTPITVKQASRDQLVWGFTLIELVMVIVIVGILAALAIPRFESFYTIKLNGAVKKVVSDIRYVQQLAVSRHADSRIEFDAGANSYRGCYYKPDGNCGVQACGSCGSTNWCLICDPFSRTALITNFTTDPKYKGINITSTNFGTNLQFNWQGVPNLASEGNIVFSYRGNSNTIYITPNTGRVRVE